MAKEYIDKKLLLESMDIAEKELDVSDLTDPEDWLAAGIEKMAECVICAPSADVAQVVHGSWDAYDDCKHVNRRLKNPEKWKIYKCSVCGYSNGRRQSNYCPNCGTKMDLEVDG